MQREFRFEDEVRHELARARRLHAPIHSLHEGYAVIAEELDEFWEHVRMRPSKRDLKAARAELIQIAAMCQRTAEDVIDRPAPIHPAAGGRQPRREATR